MPECDLIHADAMLDYRHTFPPAPYNHAGRSVMMRTQGSNQLNASQRKRIDRFITRSASPDTARVQLGRLIEAGDSSAAANLPDEQLSALLQLLGGSIYLSEILIRQGAVWRESWLEAIQIPEKLLAQHAVGFGSPTSDRDPQGFFRRLRQYKQREYLRIGGRDIAGLASVEETMHELTTLAEFTLDTAYQFCRARVEHEYGKLVIPGTRKQNRFVILGMGKLGGTELNFSSDIDVIYLYEDNAGETKSRSNRSITPLEFFGRLAELLTYAMGEVTDEGFVFRTDLRLRPMGTQGPIVQSVDSALLYYESWGQCWERSALIKARPVAGDRQLGDAFLEDVRPFVYRRYLDFATVEELRDMKARIERQQLSSSEAAERNLKIGRGGIREIEFFVQALQLVNGGYEPDIRERNTLRALAKLREHGHVPAEEAEALSSAYRFLRNAEHKIQIFAEEQSHEIPKGEERPLARRLGFHHVRPKADEVELFWQKLRKHTSVVHAAFERLFYSAQREISAQGTTSGSDVWRDLEHQEAVEAELQRHGFADSKSAYHDLVAVRDGDGAAPPSARRIKVMRDLLPALMTEILAAPQPAQALHNMGEFGRRIGARTGFLSLLAENPKTTGLLIKLFAHSQFLSELFIKRPELLDSLIRVDLTRITKSKQEMIEELAASTRQTLDLEEQLDRLRRYRSEEFLRIGLHDLGGELKFEEAIRQLSELAESCLEEALRLARRELSQQYGPLKAGSFAVLGMGKLGGRELEYNSDLDLIFLYDSHDGLKTKGGKLGKITAHEYYVKLGQRLISFLSAPTREGVVYQLDMRLRPSGRSGPLVSSLDAFRRYHETSSELWERQALIKGRYVAGDAELGEEVEAVIQRFAYRDGFTDTQIAQINHLRMRMERELAREDGSHFDVKTGRGGLIDVEFLVQMLQLLHGHSCVRVRQKNTVDALSALREEGLLGARDYKTLLDGYQFLQRLGHRLRLERDQELHTLEREPLKLRAIATALGYRKKRNKDAGEVLLDDYEKRRERIRACYEKFFQVQGN